MFEIEKKNQIDIIKLRSGGLYKCTSLGCGNKNQNRYPNSRKVFGTRIPATLFNTRRTYILRFRIQSVHENLGKILKRVQNSRKTEITIADNIFVQNGFPFKVAYLNQARSYYRADVTGVNFKDAKSNSTEIINR